MSGEKIRVIQFILSFGVGGAENIAKQYCELIDRDMFDVLVIAVSNSHSYHDLELEKKGINVIYVNDIIDKRFRILPLFFRRIMRRLLRPFFLKKVINQFNPNIIHYHLPCSKLILQSKPSKETNVILTVHSDPEYFWGDASQWKSDYSETVKLAKNYKFTFIALHEDMKNELDNVWFKNVPHKTIVYNNGIDISKFVNLSSKNEIRKELGILNETLVIGHVGSFISVKNHDYLIDVFYELKKSYSDAILLLVGDGANKTFVENKIKQLGLEKSIKLLGIRSDIPKIMKAMDVLVFPSITEGISLTLIEAQVSGLKCIISDAIPRYNNISTNLVEFLSLDESPKYWAQKVMEKYNDKNEWTCDSTAWDMKAIVKKLEEEYKHLYHINS